MKVAKEQKAANLARYEAVRKAVCEFRATHAAVCANRLGTWAEHNYPQVLRRVSDPVVYVVCRPNTKDEEVAQKFAHIAPAVVRFLGAHGFATRRRSGDTYDVVDVRLNGETFASI